MNNQHKHYTATRKAQRTGTMVTVVHADDEQLDDFGGSWYTICEHGGLVNHATLALAIHHAPAPDQWCEDCAAAAAIKDGK